MVVLEEVLSTTLPDPADPSYVRLFASRKDAAVAVANLALKVDDSRFRRKNDDALLRLLEAVKREEPALSGALVVTEAVHRVH
jgi:hypothetical protein